LTGPNLKKRGIASKSSANIHTHHKMASYSIDKIGELMVFYESAKKDSFVEFLKKMETVCPPAPPLPPGPPPTTWAGRAAGGAGEPLQLTNSPASDDDRSVHSDGEGGLIIKQRKAMDRELNLVMTRLPIAKSSMTFLLARNHYLTNPEAFNRITDSHYSGADTSPHFSVRVEVPIVHTSTGKKMNTWESIIHIYYDETPLGKRVYTYMTYAMDGETRVMAIIGRGPI